MFKFLLVISQLCRLMMSKVLVIKAHPYGADKSKTVKVLSEFMETYRTKNSNDEITELDLYRDFIPEINKDILDGWGALANGAEFSSLNDAQQKDIARINELTQQFLDTDKLVIANPLWNLGLPSKLKNWLDTICVAGKTFKYTDHGPVGLATGKNAVHIQSAGGNYAGHDFATQYISGLLTFLGVTTVQKIAIEGIDYAPERHDEIMSAAITDAKQIAEKF